MKQTAVIKRVWALCSAALLFFSFTVAAPARSHQTPRASLRQAQTAAPQTSATSPSNAQTARPTPSIADAAALVSEFDVNGMKVLVKRRPGSQTVAAGLFLRGGARNVTAANAGIEGLMLDLSSEATASFPRERLRSELSRMATSIAYGLNYDYSVLTFGSTRQSFDRSWEIFTDVALRPSFNAEDFERVKNRLVVSLSDDEDTPDSYLQILQQKAAYAGHPYLNHPRGTVQTVSRLTLEDVRRHHQQVMQTSRLLIVMVGDLDPQKIRQQLTATFGKLPRGDYRPEPLPQLSFTTQTVDVTPRDLPTNYVQGLFVAPALTSPDIYPMRIASSILRDRVFYEVRVRRNLSYAPDAFLGSQAANTGGIYVTAVDANQSVQVMLGEINRLQQEPIDASDIQSQVQQYLTRYYLGQETNAAQAGELAMFELIGGGWRNSLDFVERLRGVTPADVQRVARTYMRNIRFVVIGNPKSIDRNIFVPSTGE